MEKSLRINIENQENGTTVVKFFGEFDKIGFAGIETELSPLVASFAGATLVFDFFNLKFINSEGIGRLMSFHAHLAKSGKKLVIVGPNDHVADVLETIGLTDVIQVLASIDELS